MKKDFKMKIIAKIRTDFKEKFGIPRQSGIAADTLGRIVFEPEYRNPEALRGLEGFSHLWIIWQFSEVVKEMAESGKPWSPTVRPPRLGGNKRMGVFATRSPYRPNPIGLSSVRILGVEKTKSEGDVILVTGADLLDGTPIYDIKPYLAYTDSHPDAISGFADEVRDYALQVEIPNDIKRRLTDAELCEITEILSNDPRPSYKDDGDMEYGMSYGKYNISFKVTNKLATVTKIETARH